MTGTYKPLRDGLLLRIDKEEDKRGEIYLPDRMDAGYDRRFRICTVVAAGPQSECKVDDSVYIVAHGGENSGVPINYNGERCVLTRDRDLVGKLVCG